MSINPLKEFFRRRKAEVKFSMAGPGRKLTSDAQPSSSNTSSTSARAQAAEAAMKRFNQDSTQRPAAQRIRTSQPTSSSSVAPSQEQVAGPSKQTNPVVTAPVDTMPPSQIESITETGELDRKVQVYSLEELAKRIKTPDVDDDFFRLTIEDAQLIKKRYEEARKQDEVLKTNEMRRREAELKKSSSPVTRIRFKLPNGLILEATFRSSETLQSIKDWLKDMCDSSAGLKLDDFDLLLGHLPFKQKDLDKSVYDAGLTPASTLTLVPKPSTK